MRQPANCPGADLNKHTAAGQAVPLASLHALGEVTAVLAEAAAREQHRGPPPCFATG